MFKTLKENFQLDFIGIGVPKAGTTWIYECLKEHPQICCSEPKELHFFNKNHGFHKPNSAWRYKKGMNWYKKHFSHCKPNQLKGEIDPLYIYEREALQLIKKHFPRIKVIVSLRNPIERAYSYYYHLKSKNIFKNLSFEKAIEKEPELKEWGLYFKYIKNCLEIFSRENVLILIYEDLQKDPIKFIQKIYEFLKVDVNFVPKSVRKRINVKTIRMSQISRFTRNIYRFLVKFKIGKSFLKILRKIGIRQALIDYLVLKIKKLPKMNKETRNKLRNFYSEDIKQLELLIKRDLSFWK